MEISPLDFSNYSTRYVQFTEDITAKSTSASWFTAQYKTNISKNITTSDWNTLQHTLQFMVSDEAVFNSQLNVIVNNLRSITDYCNALSTNINTHDTILNGFIFNGNGSKVLCDDGLYRQLTCSKTIAYENLDALLTALHGEYIGSNCSIRIPYYKEWVEEHQIGDLFKTESLSDPNFWYSSATPGEYIILSKDLSADTEDLTNNVNSLIDKTRPLIATGAGDKVLSDDGNYKTMEQLDVTSITSEAILSLF